MKLVCPECKNEVDLSEHEDLSVGDTLECNMCGISLMVRNMDGEEIVAEVVEEGK